MSTRTFRVTVRGVFGGLTAEQRAELLAQAAEHDVLHAAFTAEGHLSYDLATRTAFTFRYLDSGEAEEDILLAELRAEESTTSWLTSRGYGFRNLRTQAQDLSQAPLAKRQRRAQKGYPHRTRRLARKPCSELVTRSCGCPAPHPFSRTLPAAISG